MGNDVDQILIYYSFMCHLFVTPLTQTKGWNRVRKEKAWRSLSEFMSRKTWFINHSAKTMSMFMNLGNAEECEYDKKPQGQVNGL